MINEIRSYFNGRFESWLEKRLDKSNCQTLSNRNIYIFPSKFGLVFILFIFLLFVLGTNYQNNLILLFSFIQASFFVSAMLHTFFNLSGISVTSDDEYRLFMGREGAIRLKIVNSKPYYAVNFSLGNCEGRQVDLPRGESRLDVDYLPESRGICGIPRLKISSRYAFDLFNCWSYVQFDSQLIVYPEPVEINQTQFDYLIAQARKNQNDIQDENSLIAAQMSGDDFSELRRYQLGESLSQIAWKNVAKGQPWMTKHYESSVSDKLVFSLSQIQSEELETKLGILCYVLINLHNTRVEYGLKLLNVNVLPDNSTEHFQRCLTMLAEYGGKP